MTHHSTRATSTLPGNSLRGRLLKRSWPARPVLVAALLLAVPFLFHVGSTVHAADKEITGVTVTSANPGQQSTSWDTPSNAPDDYRVTWKKSSGKWPSYKDENTTQGGNAFPTGTSHSVTGMEEGTAYKVRVRTRYHNGDGDVEESGPWSTTVEITVAQAQLPAKPTGISYGASHNNVPMFWTDPDDDSITGYQVLRGPDAANLVVLTEDTGSTDASYSDDTVEAETTYAYAIRARNAAGLGPQSDTVSVTTQAAPEELLTELALAGVEFIIAGQTLDTTGTCSETDITQIAAGCTEDITNPMPTATPTPMPVPTATGTPTTDTDREILIALYNATDGDNWNNNTNWLSDKPLHEWYGITTDNRGRVIQIILHYNGLNGQIPLQFGDLTGLEVLELNGIDGGNPNLSALSGIPRLRILSLYSNGISDSELSTLMDLPSLTFLYLRDNRISDVSPLLSFRNLEHLDLVGNPLSSSSVYTHIPILEARGVDVNHSGYAIIDGDLTIENGPLVYNDNLVVLPATRALSIRAYTRSFYNHFDDEFDFLVLVSPDNVHEVTSGGYYATVANDVQGIGTEIYSQSSEYGSAGRLHGIPFFSHVHWFRGIILHEVMHRWAAHGSHPLAEGDGHFAKFSNIFGVFGGVFSSPFEQIVDLGENRFKAERRDWSYTYGPLDLYFAGLVPPEDVPDFWVAIDGEWIDQESGTFTATSIEQYTVSDIIAAYGRRVPKASRSQREFRAAVILLIDEIDPRVDSKLLESLSADIAWFGFPGMDESEHNNFYEATGGRATITMDGLSQSLKDSGPASAPGAPAGLTATGNALPGIELSWSEPASHGELTITAYDLRHIETSADETVDSNWVVVEDVWTTGGGALEYTLTGLTADVQYDIQVRAVNATGEGPWSETVTGTPTTATDRDALVALYNATGGDNWAISRNWLSDAPLSQWHGVSTDTSGRVTRLLLDFNRLSGALPAELGNLTNLTDMNLAWNDIRDLSGLAGLSSLKSLDLTEIRGSQTLGAEERSPLDLSPLAGLTSLTQLNLSQNKISDLSPLASLTNLKSLNLVAVHIRWDASDTSTLDLSPLASLTELADLDLHYNNVTDISPLVGLINLTRLDIRSNHISDISPLAGLTKLVYLNGQQNKIANVSPLSGLTALQEVVLSNNLISDISPLVANTGLGRGDVVDVRTNPLNAESTSTHIPALLARGVDVSSDAVIVFADPQVYNGNVFVMPVSENLAAGNLPLKDYASRFFERFNDEFDFLMFVPNLAPGQHAPGVDVKAYYAGVKNDVQGIGKSINANNDKWGSAGRLQGVVDFGGYSIYADRGLSILAEGPTLHELMHRWANFVVPSSYGSHWGFSSANGNIGGFDIADLVDHGGGRYTAGNFTVSGSADNVEPYSPIELYLAGFIPPQEVPDLWVAEDGEWLLDEEGGIVYADNGYPIFTASQVVTYTIEDIIAKHGPRVPDASEAQKDFRAAVILLIDQNHPATRESLETLSDDASWFSHAGEDETYRYNFYEATGGRATITMDGLSQFLKDSSPATLPDVPTDLTATGNGLPGIDLSWSAPASDGGSVITAYDLRYVETSADGTLDSNWTAVDDVWTTGSGDLQYTLTGLTADTEYDLQLRAVNAVGDGPWSATVTATPTTASTCDTGSAVPDPTNSPGLVSVCESLLTLLDTLVESNVLNWSADIPISEWDGIRGDSLEGTPPQVVKLYLGGFGLDGKVPGELSGLTELKELYLHDNDLSGPIPPELGGLSNLTHLHLQNNDLTSGIPAELGELTSLKRLFLHSNNLTGVIPVELGKLTRLTHLWLKDNDLTGGIPSELGNMSSLDWLHIAENDISGQIPTELGTLTKLRRLYVYENDLSGPLPDELGSLTRLTHIVAQENDLSGQIPAELGNLANLVWLGLYDNDLEGEIPDELGGLAKLQRLYLHHNELSGEIPEDLGNLSEMTNLWLNHNYLSGQIPESLGDLEKVTRLRLAGNEFTGCLPAGLAAVSNSDADQLGLETCGSSSSGAVSDAHDTHGNGNDPFSSTARETPAGAGDCTTGSAVSDAANNLGLVSDCQTLLAMRDVLVSPLADGEPRLNWSSDTPITDWDGIGDDSLQGSPTRVTRLYLNGLGLDGMIASELSNLSALRVLYLHDNELTGTIPPALGDLPKLTYLYAHNNDLTGSIPAELGELTSLKRLFLHSNNLTGVIPVELGKLTRLTHLWLKDNDLTGGIPSELGNMSSLDWLHIAENDISGQIPAELGTLTKLRRLYVYENDLSGPLPDELGSLTRLTHIVAQENDLSGEIPAELGNLANLVWLGLYDNDLEGEIPDELGGLAKLQRLYLHHNELSGKIPEELSELSELTNLWLNHNYLSGQIPESLGDLEKVTRLRLAGNEFTGCLPAGLASVSNSDADQLGLETCSEN